MKEVITGRSVSQRPWTFPTREIQTLSQKYGLLCRTLKMTGQTAVKLEYCMLSRGLLICRARRVDQQ